MSGILRLDPLQRLVGLSFGNRLAILYAYGGRANAFIPPQVRVSVTQPVSFALIDSDAILDARGIGSADSPSIGEEVTGEMLRAYRAWRYQSVEAFSAGHADLIGIHCALVLNLAKFADTPSNIEISLSVAGIGANFDSPDVALSTFRNVWSVSLLSEGIGNAVVGGDFVNRAGASRQTPGVITGSINPRTLAVTLTGESSGSGGGGAGGGEG